MPRFLLPAALLGLFVVTGCSWFGGDDTPAKPTSLVVGDEPYAVEAGAGVLREGGSAADAATAIYFALAATYPVAAGLGGGGICLVHDEQTNRVESFSFLARSSSGGGAYAVPAAVRGFALLQQNYGRIPWQRDVAPGEGFATAGFTISRALAARIEESQNVIRLDATLSAEFLTEAGTVKPAGSIVSNPALGATLSLVRRYGPDGFYLGPVAQKIAAYSKSLGGGITEAELAGYTPGREAAQTRTIGNVTAYIPPDNLGAGKFAQSILSRLVDEHGDASADAAPFDAIANATKSALDQFGVGNAPKDLGATGFAAIDDSGQAVACAVTMYGPFGSGHTAEGTGVTLANSPTSSSGIAAAFLTPVIATASDGSTALVGAGSGGPNGTAAIMYALAKLAGGDDITKPGELHSTGIAPYETLNLIACPGNACATVPDPGAHGLGAAVGGE